MPKVSELIELLNRTHKPTDTIAWSIWVAEDVMTAAVDMGKPADSLTPDDTAAILDELHDSQDCEIGLNWRTMHESIRWHQANTDKS